MSVDRRDEDAATGVERHGGPARTRTATERFAVRSAAALLATVGAGLGFGVLTALIRVRWQPLQAADQAVADRVTAVVAEHPIARDVLTAVTDFGATLTMTGVLAVAVLWLLLRRLPRLAVLVVLTGAGGLILNPVVKELVARLRPVVETPVYRTDGWSFPSGHAMGSLVCYGILLLVFTPVLHTRARRVVTGCAVLLVVAVGLSRVALGVHYLTDVVAGWLLGSLWLAAITVAFHRWRGEAGLGDTGPLPGDVEPDDRDDLRPVPRQHLPTMPHPWRGLGELTVAWVLLVGLLIGLGKLVSIAGTGNPVARWDHRVLAALAAHRGPVLTTALDVFGELGNTTAVITAALIIAVLAVAVLRSRRPVLFLGVALLGEITLFLTASAIVDRPRPEITPLDPPLPPTASFPSGHLAASLTLYAGSAALLWYSTRRRPYRLLAAAMILIPALVAAQRVYSGAHHPTDLLGSVLLASIWTTVAWWVVRPVPIRQASTRGVSAAGRQPWTGRR
ncbi:phosphatase PAP2 family protein [Nocardia sienata]|uniref:phosphatase PAP2 family protein n=1 Tax=Nocardia sienata TaxID=248552 RepID=UPI0007A440D4|nr:phosphatase PAP2 family protein [Nocardia sienata]